MTEDQPRPSILERLDQLYEFERQPVTEDRLQGGGYFAGVYAGEHIAGTEFVIGALFVSFGARTWDVLVGLLLGNLLAVLSWALVCAPIAVETRLTLYWYLRRIAGPGVTAAYNVLNALLYCILAGAMITVSASAIRIPFGIPAQHGWLPEDFRFVLVVWGVGAVVVTLAILGFRRLAQFSMACSPWMVVMFLAGALAMLPTLGKVDSFGAFWRVAEQEIWKGPGPDVAHPLGFWHIAAFAWICNLAMHLGLSDMALLRFAKRPAYGLYSAFGMYLGHYVAWICVGIMWAATAAVVLREDPAAAIDSGEVATRALGAMGAVCVVLAGWTTANPTLYRAGLALQVVTPGWPRWLVTLAAGAVTTLIACSPIFFVGLLDFVAVYGLLLAPVGAIVVAEHWLMPRLGLARFWSARKGQRVNWSAVVSWLAALGFVALTWGTKAVTGIEILHEFFLVIPVWLLTTGVYVVLSYEAGAGGDLPELPELPAPEVAARGGSPARHGPSGGAAGLSVTQSPPRSRLLYGVSAMTAVVSLALCLALAVAVFRGWITLRYFHSRLTPLTVLYFVAAAIWLGQRERPAGRQEAVVCQTHSDPQETTPCTCNGP